MFGYLNMLVELRIFHKVEVGFLLVGHTHEHIDQMFIHFARTLRRNKLWSLPSLIEIVRKAYHPDPVVLTSEEIVDMQRYIMDHVVKKGALKKLMTLAFNINFV